MMVALLMCVVSVFAETSVSVEPPVPEFLTGFASFTGSWCNRYLLQLVDESRFPSCRCKRMGCGD